MPARPPADWRVHCGRPCPNGACRVRRRRMSSASAARPAGCVCRTPRCCLLFCFFWFLSQERGVLLPVPPEEPRQGHAARQGAPVHACPGPSPRLRRVVSGGIKLMLWDDDSNETGVATDRAFLGQFEVRPSTRVCREIAATSAQDLAAAAQHPEPHRRRTWRPCLRLAHAPLPAEWAPPRCLCSPLGRGGVCV